MTAARSRAVARKSAANVGDDCNVECAAEEAFAEIERRLEILDGYLIAYLNLDKLIKIIREEDEPKPKMIKAFGLTDLQAESILNMRLRDRKSVV